MNFATIRTIIDQKADNGYAVTMPMWGTITEFKGEGLSSSNKPWKKVVIQDDNGEKHNVTLRGTLPGPQVMNQRCQFDLSAYAGQLSDGQSYTGYSGFWKHGAQAGQQGQQAPPQARQAPNVPTPAPQRPQNTTVDHERRVKNRGICLSYALEHLTIPLQDAYAAALEMAEFIETGIIPRPKPRTTASDEYDASNVPGPDPNIQEGGDDSEIPF